MSDYNLTEIGMDNDHFATIKVIGIGGGGCNAVNRMIENNVKGIEFITINTDNQSLQRTKATNKLQIGEKITKGLGAGADPDIGEKAAIEAEEEIIKLVEQTDMLFITAGMGGGTGTGGAPVISKIARDQGILSVGVVTRPFRFEGSRRMMNAEKGIREMEKHVDSLIVVPNDKLLEVAGDDTSLDEAFGMADQVLMYGVSGISDLVAIPGLINLDLADVRRIMTNAGVCHMGIGRASGEDRASEAIMQAINSPLLDTTIDGAKGVIMNFTGGKDMKIKEVDKAASIIRDSVSPDADIIFGAVVDPELDDEIVITVIASGFGERKNRNNKKVDMKDDLSSDDSQEIQEKTEKENDVPEFLSTIGRGDDTKKMREEKNEKSGFVTIGEEDEEEEPDSNGSKFKDNAEREKERIPVGDEEEENEDNRIIRPDRIDNKDNPDKKKKKHGKIIPWFLQDKDR